MVIRIYYSFTILICTLSHDCLTQKLSNSEIVPTSLCAGAIAGALAKTTIAPLDRTKINFQISNKPYSTKKALKFLLQTYREQGVFALWRGNSATMVRIVPYAAIQFTAHEQWKRILKVDNKSPKKLFLVGSLAGATSQSLTYPLDVARARMAVTHKQEYATLRHVFYKIFREEGITAFYKGYIPTVAGVIPYAGVSYFFTYDSLKLLYKEYYSSTCNEAPPHPVISLGFGAVAGMLGQCSSYPLDIVRRRMQTDTQGKYKTIRATVKIIYKEGIIGGFYKGLSMNWIKGPIAVGISYSSYDNIRNFFRQLAAKYNNKKIL